MSAEALDDARRSWLGVVAMRERGLRRERDLSRTALARMSGVKPSSIQNVELGTRDVGISVMARLAAAYAVDVGWLLAVDDPSFAHMLDAARGECVDALSARALYSKRRALDAACGEGCRRARSGRSDRPTPSEADRDELRGILSSFGGDREPLKP